AGIEGGDDKVRFQAAQYLAGGDVILQVDGHDIVTPNDLGEIIAARQPGEMVAVTLLRNGERKEIELKLGKRPDSPTSE
ncbi:MAG TPA: PDZ domain-containing protein, partial [Solirubrobacterales bacterium]|nr:PDZ domain-containing protein [Solirubrobacterales bacterium]